jgi:uncharacterized protein
VTLVTRTVSNRTIDYQESLVSTTPPDHAVQRADHDRRIDYIEFPATDVPATKQFYINAFGWKFTDYGPDYTSFEDGRLTGGFYKADSVRNGGALVVLFAVDLASAEASVRQAGGTVVKPAYSFPGGRRFHFADPSGNQLAIWSDR